VKSYDAEKVDSCQGTLGVGRIKVGPVERATIQLSRRSRRLALVNVV